MTTSPEETCGCGLPLHYTDPAVEAEMRALVEALGPTVTVKAPGGTWEVPRHFIALHEFRASDVKYLAVQYGWRKVH